MKLIDFPHLCMFVLYDAMQKMRNFDNKCFQILPIINHFLPLLQAVGIFQNISKKSNVNDSTKGVKKDKKQPKKGPKNAKNSHTFQRNEESGRRHHVLQKCLRRFHLGYEQSEVNDRFAYYQAFRIHNRHQHTQEIQQNLK